MTKPIRLRGKGAHRPSPYLREWWSRIQPPLVYGVVVDLACGNGRNARYAQEAGCVVMAFDKTPDLSIQPHPIAWRAGEVLPLPPRCAQLILCQYLLMLLADSEIAATLHEIHRVLAPGGHVLIEIEPTVLTARPMSLDRVCGYLQGLVGADVKHGYQVVHFTKERCILKKLG